MDNLQLAQQLVEEILEMVENRKDYDENDNFWDYLSGCIDTRVVMVGRLGYPNLIENIVTEVA